MEEYAGDYTIFLYDRQQAEALQAKLISYEYPHTSTEHIVLDGFKDRVTEPCGRKPSYLTPEERAEARRVQGRKRQREYLKRQKTEQAHGRASRSQAR